MVQPIPKDSVLRETVLTDLATTASEIKPEFLLISTYPPPNVLRGLGGRRRQGLYEGLHPVKLFIPRLSPHARRLALSHPALVAPRLSPAPGSPAQHLQLRSFITSYASLGGLHTTSSRPAAHPTRLKQRLNNKNAEGKDN